MLRAAGASSEGRLFAHLHDGRCQPKKKKNTGETLNFGNINFQPRPRCQMYLPTPAAEPLGHGLDSTVVLAQVGVRGRFAISGQADTTYRQP